MRRHPVASRTLLAPTLALLLVLSACTSSSDGTDAGSSPSEPGRVSTTTAPPAAAQVYEGDEAGFYAVPDPLPAGPHGTLIRYQAMDDYELGASTPYRIMYLSESLGGEPIAVTGMASVPTADAPEGGRPMVTIAHATTGIADECAPSKNPRSTEMSLVRGHLGDDFLIAATDYEGLGTPGRHPYLVGESEGRGAIDAILAARSLPDADAGSRVGIAGYSQGGHGALWTSQVAAEWAPELEVVGTYSGAPATEVGVIVAAAQRVKGFGAMVIAGIHAAHPDADLAEVLTPTGIEVLDVVDEGCAPNTFRAVGEYEGDEIFVADGGTSGRWSELARAQDAGQEKTNDAPTLIVRSTADATVPEFFVQQVLARMCANGQVVERLDIDGGGHTEAAIPAYEAAMAWMRERFAPDGEPPVDSCP